MTAALSCEVYVDEHRLADTAAEWESSIPTVLSELAVTWGRETVIDQPSTSTCTLTVADRDYDGDFLGLLHVGRPLRVYAAGELATGGEPVDVAVDGNFDDPTIPLDERMHVVGGHAEYGTWEGQTSPHVRVTQTAYAPYWCRAMLPVAPFSTEITAWDLIPTVRPGEQWRLNLSVIGGRAAGGQFRAAIFDGPSDQDPTIIGEPVDVPWEGLAGIAVRVTIPDDAPRGWIGLVFDLTVRQWVETPGTWADTLGTWIEWPSLVVDFYWVWAPPSAERRVLVFAGRITDLAVTAAARGIRVAVTAADVTAELGNLYVGDEPWPVQRLGDRAQRILALAGGPVVADIDPRLAALRVSWRDVDNAAVISLLTELAETADGVLWSAEHATRGPYLWLEDTAARVALGVLTFDTARRLVVVSGNVRPSEGIVVSACDLARESVTWAQDVADVLTRVDASWQEQTVDEEGKPAPTERHEIVVDAAAEAEFGVRRAGYSTQLITAGDARTVGIRVLSRSRSLGWHASGLTWDTDRPAAFTDNERRGALDLLDGTRRIGLPVTVTDLPRWSPGGETENVYVEGGTYTYAGGRWILDTTISPAGSTGYSVQWADLDPAWSWDEFDPSISWWVCWGVTADYASPRWAQLDDHSWIDDPHVWLDYFGPQTTRGS